MARMRGLASRARALEPDVDVADAELPGLGGGVLGRELGGEGRPLAGSLEPGRAGAGPDDGRADVVGDGDDRIVEGGLDVGHPESDLLADLFLLGAGFWRHVRLALLTLSCLFELLDPLAA